MGRYTPGPSQFSLNDLFYGSFASASDGKPGIVFVNPSGQSISFDTNGNQNVTLGTKIDPTNDGITTYPFGHSYAHINTSATTTVKSGSGVLEGVIVGGAGSSWTATIYDNTAGSGTVIAVLTPNSAHGSIDANLAFSTGLTVVTAGTTAGDLTFVYR